MALWSKPGDRSEWSPDESRGTRWFYLAAVLAVLAIFVILCLGHWVAAHPGVDQNGYLVGGKMFARAGTPKLTPTNPVTGKFDPYLFVGQMWVGADLNTDAERYYPKYPLGVPMLVAGALRLGGPNWGLPLAYGLSPACMALGLLATFLLMRSFIGSFLALLGVALVATSPVTLMLATNPNSHAPDFFFVIGGFLALFSWARGGGLGRAVLAGLLLGYAVTIRYTEGLLILPLALAILLATRWRVRRSRGEAIAMLVAWLLPVVALVEFNALSLGTLTGYDPTNESTGFGWEYFLDNWQTMLQQLHATGLVFFFPLALAGLVLAFWWNWRLALILAAWIVPTVLIYTAYYWAPDGRGISYLRFFLSVLPAMAICAMAVIAHLGANAPADPPAPAWRRYGTPLFAGALTALAILLNVQSTLADLRADYAMRLGLQEAAQDIMAVAPPGSVVLARDTRILHHLQFASDYQLYDLNSFDRRAVQRMAKVNADEPQGLQPQRAEAIYNRLKRFDQKKLNQEQQSLVLAALDAGRHVYVIAPPNAQDIFKRVSKAPGDPPIYVPQQLAPELFETKVVSSWSSHVTGGWPLLRHGPRANRRDPPPPRFDPQASHWRMIELSRKTSATADSKS